MSDIETSTVSDEGFSSTSQVGDFELTIDATGEEGPTPQQTLVADYASCYLPAFRVAGQRSDYDDLGKVQIDADADMDDNDDVQAVRFTVHTEAEIDDGDADELVEKADDICHVHDALREELHAEVDVNGGAF
ncbi:OsmC family protein [Halobium palmae]|uniref:OsmC family protein n=1 Tax=Halobium palmae TaxID=1776492 RepID=A0ABD5RXG2_9EURY